MTIFLINHRNVISTSSDGRRPPMDDRAPGPGDHRRVCRPDLVGLPEQAAPRLTPLAAGRRGSSRVGAIRQAGARVHDDSLPDEPHDPRGAERFRVGRLLRPRTGVRGLPHHGRTSDLLDDRRRRRRSRPDAGRRAGTGRLRVLLLQRRRCRGTARALRRGRCDHHQPVDAPTVGQLRLRRRRSRRPSARVR